jgi:hypothetical protein
MKSYITSIIFATSSALLATTWTSNDGKTIEADFVKLEGEILVLKKGVDHLRVPMARLNADSQAFASFSQKSKLEWATLNAVSPIISEAMLASITDFKPDLAEGKNYLVEGNVATIRAGGTTLSPSNKVDVTLAGGTKFQIDFSDKANGLSTKMKVEEDQVILLKPNSFGGSGYKDFVPAGFLLQSGQSIVIRAIVKDAKILGQGMPTSAELTEARLQYAKQNGGLAFEDAARLEELRIRAEYLESQLKEGKAGTAEVSTITGYAGTITLEYTDAEKEKMRKELELLRAQIAVAAKP